MGIPRVYVANPIAGKPNRNIEYARFVGSIVEAMGAEAVVPQDIVPEDHLGDCPPGYAEGEGHSSACHLRADTVGLLGCDGVLLGLGWEGSVGCQFEAEVARMTGIPVFYIDEEGTVFDASSQPVEAFS